MVLLGLIQNASGLLNPVPFTQHEGKTRRRERMLAHISGAFPDLLLNLDILG